MDEQVAEPEGAKWAKWALFGVPTALVLLCLWGGMLNDDSDDEATAWDAERVCKEDFIAKRLKAPASAKYDLDVSGGPTRFTVSGTVDAENSFGAMLRSNVTCIVEDAGDRWRLVSVSGLD